MSNSKIPIIRRTDSNSDLTDPKGGETAIAATAAAMTSHHHHYQQQHNPSSEYKSNNPSQSYNGGSGQFTSKTLLAPPNMMQMGGMSPSNMGNRHLMPRPSVRSISDAPNVIGAQANQYQNDLCSIILTCLSWSLVVLFFPLSLAFLFRVIQEYERAVIFKLGRLKVSSCGPGIVMLVPCIENMLKVDMRTVSFDVAPQEVLTKDSVTVAVDAVVYYRVFNPAVSVANVENAQESTRLLAQTSLRNVLGQKSLSEILSERESVSRAMRECLDEATDPWGIEVERVEFKDVRLPVQLQRAMATEAEASREARAKVIAAEGEQRAARAIKGAADIIGASPCAIQLRYLQTLSNIATEKNSTIIFPVPIELFDVFRSGLSANLAASGGGGAGSGGDSSSSKNKPYTRTNTKRYSNDANE